MDITVDTSQMMELADVWQRAPKLTRKEFKRAATEIDLLVQGELQQELPRGAGGLHGAGLAGSVARKEHVLSNRVVGMVFTSEPYATYVELGTRPHKPPIQPLKDWVEAVIGLRGEDAEEVAEAISWKIARHGTEGTHTWAKTYRRLVPAMQRKVGEALARIRHKLDEATP